MKRTQQKNTKRDRQAQIDTGTDYLGVTIAGQTVGIPVTWINDILDWQQMTRVPGSPDFVRGLINLRGRIVTAIDMRTRLGCAETLTDDHVNHVVVEKDGEPYSLVVDEVEEIRNLNVEEAEATPPILDASWREVCDGVVRIEADDDIRLLLLANVESILDFERLQQRSQDAA